MTGRLGVGRWDLQFHTGSTERCHWEAGGVHGEVEGISGTFSSSILGALGGPAGGTGGTGRPEVSMGRPSQWLRCPHPHSGATKLEGTRRTFSSSILGALGGATGGTGRPGVSVGRSRTSPEPS